MDKLTLRDNCGRIIGTIETDSNGNKTVRSVTGRILGYYKKNTNVTTDVTGRIITRGDASAMLFNM